MKERLRVFVDKYTFFGFTIIPVVLYTFFYVYSVGNGIWYSFSSWNGIDRTYDMVGLENYRRLFENPNFWRSLRTTIHYALLLIVGVITISLMLALCLNSLKRVKNLVSSIYFVPAMIGSVTIALIWDQLFFRAIPVLGELLNIDLLKQSLLALPTTAIYAVVFVNIWQAVAMPTVIFMAGLQTIDEAQYESAMLDGATTFGRFRHITLPHLLPTIVVNLVLTIKQGFTTFDYPYALTGGGPVRSTEVFGIIIYNDAFSNMRFATANAEACILFVIVAFVSIIQIRLSHKKGVDA